MPSRRKLTEVLREATAGSSGCVDELFGACYDELHRLAHKYLANERSDHTLQTTELVHEAYLRLVDSSRLGLRNRAHFFAVAARVMRRILVDHARSRSSAKRVGRLRRVPLEEAHRVTRAASDLDLVALDVALSRFQEEAPEKARVLEMRFFGGMNYEEIATVLGVSPRTARRHAAYAQARLYEMMREMSF